MPQPFIVHQCAWCGAFKIGRRYLKLPGVPLVTGTLELRRPSQKVCFLAVKFSHGICGPCAVARVSNYLHGAGQ